MTCRSPSASACHSASWSDASRAGGENIHFAPSMPGLSRSCRVRNRYCGQVSAKIFRPSPRALRITCRAFGGRDVEDHDRLVDQRRAGDQPRERLRLAHARMRDAVEFRRRVAVLEQPLAHPRDHAVVLGVHAHHRAVVARGLQHVEQLLVVDLEPVVGHEHLQRGVAGLHQRRDFLLQHLLARVGEDHVERVVDHARRARPAS